MEYTSLDYKLDMALALLQQILAAVENDGMGVSGAVAEQDTKMTVVRGG